MGKNKNSRPINATIVLTTIVLFLLINFSRPISSGSN